MNSCVGDVAANENFVIMCDEETERRGSDVDSSTGGIADLIPNKNLSLRRMSEIHRIILIDEQRIRNVANDRTVRDNAPIRIPGGVREKFWSVEGTHFREGQSKHIPWKKAVFAMFYFSVHSLLDCLLKYGSQLSLKQMKRK